MRQRVKSPPENKVSRKPCKARHKGGSRRPRYGKGSKSERDWAYGAARSENPRGIGLGRCGLVHEVRMGHLEAQSQE